MSANTTARTLPPARFRPAALSLTACAVLSLAGCTAVLVIDASLLMARCGALPASVARRPVVQQVLADASAQAQAVRFERADQKRPGVARIDHVLRLEQL